MGEAERRALRRRRAPATAEEVLADVVMPTVPPAVIGPSAEELDTMGLGGDPMALPSPVVTPLARPASPDLVVTPPATAPADPAAAAAEEARLLETATRETAALDAAELDAAEAAASRGHAPIPTAAPLSVDIEAPLPSAPVTGFSSSWARVPAVPAAPPPPAAPPEAPMSPEEAALWAASGAMPALGEGPVDLAGALAPTPPAELSPDAWAREAAAARARPADPLASAVLGPRRSRGGAAAPRVAPGEERDPLIDALIARPMDAANPYDNRSETGLERDLRLNADAETLAVRRAENAAIAAANVRDVYEGEARARAELETERRNATRAGQDSYRRAVDRAASLNIDPDGFYHSRGTGGTIASAIAIGLGGLGSAINGGPNVALDMINAEIDRDLMAQQQRIDSAWQRADAEGTLYDMTRAEYGDREAALNAARSIALENAAAQAEEQAGMLGTAEARLQGEALAAELRDAAISSRAEAERAEIEWQLRMMNLEGLARERQAAAAVAERRAAGGTPGPVAPRPITAQQMDVFNRDLATTGDRVHAAAAAGIDLAMAPMDGMFAEPTAGPESVRDAELSAALDRLEQLVPSDTSEDVPGVGMTGMLPAAIISDEGRALREEAENVIDLLGRSRTGANMPPTELATYRRLLLGSAETDEGLRRGISRLRDLIEGRTRRTREGRVLDDVEGDALEGLGGRVVVD